MTQQKDDPTFAQVDSKKVRRVAAIALAALTAAAWIAFRWQAVPSEAPLEERLLSISQEAGGRPGEPILPLRRAEGLDPAKVALGRQLFRDPRLSADDSISCATCHPLERGGADGLPVSPGVGGAQGNINAPSVLTAAHNFRQFWDGRAVTLEEQAGGPITNPIEMASTWEQVLAKLRADGDLARNFAQAYPAGLTPDTIRHALAEFERSLPAPSRFDRWLLGDDGALAINELAGYRLFKKHGCSGCHQGRNVGGNLFQRFGVMTAYFAGKTPSKADLGRFNVTGRDEDRHVFKVPSLRNVARTAPYFHDASATRLEDAVRVMGRHQLGMELPDSDITQIVAFLRTLDSESAP